MSAVNHTRERRGANSVLYLVREPVSGSQSSMLISRMAEVGTDQASVDAVEPSWSNECSESY